MRISVFITSYNQKTFLVEAIESVLNQSFPPSQIVVVDDSSSDGSQEIVAGYASRYPELITAINHSYNQGVAQTRTDALRAITGDYVSYIDGDDKYLPTKLENEARLLRSNPNVQIAFSNNYYMSVNGIRTGIWADGVMPPQGDVFRRTFARDFPRRNLFRMELVEYRAWKRIGFYDPCLDLYEDFDMRIRLTRNYRVIYCDEPLTEIRIHKNGLSSAPAAKHLVALEYIYRKNFPLMEDLNVAERKDVRQKLNTWMARIARRAVVQALRDSRYQRDGREQALGYFLRCVKYQPSSFDYKLLVKIMLPSRVYELLRAVNGLVQGSGGPIRG